MIQDSHSQYQEKKRNMENFIKIIILNNHFIFRLKHQEGKENLFNKIELNSPDMIFLDINDLTAEEIDIAYLLKKRYPDIKILIRTYCTCRNNLLKLYNTNIDGIINNDATSGELINIVDTINKGNKFFSKEINIILNSLEQSKENNELLKFTNREKEVLVYAAKGFFAKEIAAKLNLSPKTIDVHKSNIFKKLGINNSVELVHYAIKRGLIQI